MTRTIMHLAEIRQLNNFPIIQNARPHIAGGAATEGRAQSSATTGEFGRLAGRRRWRRRIARPAGPISGSTRCVALYPR